MKKRSQSYTEKFGDKKNNKTKGQFQKPIRFQTYLQTVHSLKC